MNVKKIMATLLCTLTLAFSGVGCLALAGCSGTGGQPDDAALNQVQDDADAVEADDGGNASVNEADEKETADTVDEADGDLDVESQEVAPDSSSN